VKVIPCEEVTFSAGPARTHSNAFVPKVISSQICQATAATVRMQG
jgi:hypothetical protein